MCTCTFNWGCACVYAHMCGDPSFTLLSFLIVLRIIFSQGFSCLCLPGTGIIDKHCSAQLFAQLLRIQTQVLRFAWQTRYLTSHLPDPEFYLNYVLWLFLKTKNTAPPQKTKEIIHLFMLTTGSISVLKLSQIMLKTLFRMFQAVSNKLCWKYLKSIGILKKWCHSTWNSKVSCSRNFFLWLQ